ncbi:MAG: VapC toxin family PIN domain ribonuclease [Rhizobiales bacterium]|nr:VapC toxin family PIN domain ribonuclease [Hyphomicrobiales bacterium]MBA70452.1 VapC toxin family PIN domain ribonuclease [Hyphomicrobiales bacterium]|tara:strand:- start:1066 stop:1443 length:378 start_codon:yes stop_codon:yes gene_type:complete
MRVIDSSVWVEILADGPVADRLLAELPENPAEIVVPSIVVLEVVKWIEREADTTVRHRFLAFVIQCVDAPLDTERALAAARIHRTHGLATADAIVYATAMEFDAELVTCDSHFRSLDKVIHIPNK